ncbi:hypothetical protein EBB07_13310 [Paenibacillaceae bacterium]|nr:hypothetical protein EBB07_13310 [Paenibacillaceae bacterium]
MKIRIKVKHLALSLLLCCALLIMLFGLIIPEARLQMAERQLAQGNLESKQAIVDAILHPTSQTRKWELIKAHIIEHTPESILEDFNIYVGPGHTTTTGGDQELPFNWEEKLPFLEMYVEGAPADGYLVRAAKQLAYYYSTINETSKPIALLNRAEERLPDNYRNQRLELALERGKLTALAGDLDEADRVLVQTANETGSNYSYLQTQIAKVRADIMLQKGALQDSLAQLEQAIKQAEQADRERKNTGSFQEGWKNSELENLMLLRETLRSEVINGTETSTLSGTLRRNDGTPISRAAVFLREERIVNQSPGADERYQTLTDSEGRYSFKGVIPGSYQIYLGLTFEQMDGWTWPVNSNDWLIIKGSEQAEHNLVMRPLLELYEPVNERVIEEGKVHFAWEPVEDADYYELSAIVEVKNGSIGTIVRSHVRGTEMDISTAELYDAKMGLSYSGEDMTIDPQPLLGFANPEGRYFWSVQAYDAAGKLLTKSSGYRLNQQTIGNLPFFYLRERELTAADRLLLEGRLEEAMAAYQADFTSEPDNVHHLRMMVKLLEAKASMDRKRTIAPEEIHYLEQLATMHPTQTSLFDLLYYYYDQEDWPAYNKTYQAYMKIIDDQINHYVQAIHGTALLKQGKWQEAEIELAASLAADESHRFIGTYLATLIYNDKGEEALKAAQRYPERMFGPPARNWENMMERLRVESHAVGSVAYLQEIRSVLDWFSDSQQEQLKQWKEQTPFQALKNFVAALENVR